MSASGASETARPRVSLRGLLKDSAVFGFGGTLSGLAGVVTFPIVARFLGPEDFGVLSLYHATLNVAAMVAALGLPHAFFRFYTERGDAGWASRTLSSVFWAMAISSAVVAALLFGLGAALNRLLAGAGGAEFVAPLCLATLATAFESLASSRLQADGERRRFLGLTVFRVAGSRVLPAGLVVLGLGVPGAVWGEAASMALVALGAGLFAFRDLRARADGALMRQALAYGGALTPGSLAIWLLRGADKYMLRLLAADPLRQVGFYGVAERVSGALHLVGQGAVLGWRRFAFQNMHDEANKPLLARGATVLLVGMGYCAFALALLGEDILYWLVGPSFLAAAPVIPILALATLLSESQSILRIGLLRGKRTGLVSAIAAASALVNLVLNFLAIPRYGLIGAAWATLFSQFLHAAVAQHYSQRAFRVPFEWARMGRAAALFVAVCAIGANFSPAGRIAGAAVRVALLAATAPALFAIGFFRPDERAFFAKLSGAVSRWRGR